MGVSEQIQRLWDDLIEARGSEKVYKQQLEELALKENELIKETQSIDKAKMIVQTISQQTQKKLEYHINGLVSSGLESVFKEPYEFNLRFVTRRNKVEADLIFSKNGNETSDILNSGGGGVADIASYLLSIAVFSIHPSRPIFIRDENFKFLHSNEFQEKTSTMIKKVAEKFGIQMIMISDQPNLYKNADNVLVVKIKDGISTIINQSYEE